MAPNNTLCIPLGDGDALAEIDVLDGVQQLDAFIHRLLERLAAADHATAAGALVDHGRGDSPRRGRCRPSAARVDQPAATHVAGCHLQASHVDRVSESSSLATFGSVLPNLSASKPLSCTSGSFCLMMSASIVTPRWLAWAVRSAATW